ncbi:MAG: HAMP domain-containing protein [Deltaproteobacteria bacterium]|nr:HAMP domain-containing protein [Deltaproteobacteria bacterium]
MRLEIGRLVPHLGIRGKMLVAFLTLAIAPFAVFASVGLRFARQALVRSNSEHLRIELASNVSHIERYLGLVGADVRMLARAVGGAAPFVAREAQPRPRAALEAIFREFAAIRPDYYQIRFLSSDGRELVRVDRRGDVIVAVPEAELQDKSNRYYFAEAMAGPPDRPYFSPIDLNVEHDRIEEPHELVLRVAHRVEQPTQGVVVLNVFASRILGQLRVLRPDLRASVLFVDEQGRYVEDAPRDGSRQYAFGNIGDRLAMFPEATRSSLLAGDARFLAEGSGAFVSFHAVRAGQWGAQRRWTLAILYPRALVLGPVDDVQRFVLLSGFLVGLGAVVLSLLATRAFTRPIRRILAFVQRVAAGEFGGALDVETHDELEELANGIRSTAGALERARAQLIRWNEELQAEVSRKVAEIDQLREAMEATAQQLRHADRLASLGLLSASLAHEIGNPLASIKTTIQVEMAESIVPTTTQQTFRVVLDEIDRLAGILSRMTGFVRPARNNMVATTVAKVFDRVGPLVEREARRKQVAVRLCGAGVGHRIVARAEQLEQVLLNLLVNALEAMDGPGQVTIEAEPVDPWLEILVSDTGRGIPDTIRDRAFEPFFTTKPNGTGLGLAIVREIVRDIGGEVEIEASGAGGARVRVRLRPGGDDGAREVPP